VVSTINGDANVPFYKELGNQKISAEDIRHGLSVVKRNLQPGRQAAGGSSCRLEYFMSIDTR